MKRFAELDSMQKYYFERFDGLHFGECICHPSLSPNRLCSSFALAVVSGLWFIFRLSGHHGCAMLSERRDVRNRKASERKMQLVVSSKSVSNQVANSLNFVQKHAFCSLKTN